MLINPCWDVYQVATTCPLLWDVLGFPGSIGYLPEGASVYFNRTDVQRAVNAPIQEWEECSNGVLDDDTSVVVADVDWDRFTPAASRSVAGWTAPVVRHHSRTSAPTSDRTSSRVDAASGSRDSTVAPGGRSDGSGTAVAPSATSASARTSPGAATMKQCAGRAVARPPDVGDHVTR